MLKKDITKLLQIQYPIIQAPMAGGVTTSTLVAAVSNNGGLGMIGAGYLNAEKTRMQEGTEGILLTIFSTVKLG